MAEFEKSCDAIFPGIRREIIALSKPAEFVAVQEMKAAEMKGDKDGSLSAEEIEKRSPIAQKFAKLDVVDRFLIYRLIDLLFEMIFEEADARETDIKLRHGNQKEDAVTSANQATTIEDLDQAAVPSTANYSEHVNAEEAADPQEMSALDVLGYCLSLQRERLHRMSQLEEKLAYTFSKGYQEFEAEQQITGAVRKLEPAIRKQKAERTDRNRRGKRSDRDVKLHRIKLLYPDLVPQVVARFQTMLHKEGKAGAEEKRNLGDHLPGATNESAQHD
jgi:hypothetical protein